jgi:glutamine amidotransferase
MKIAIVDYESGNLKSVSKAVEFASEKVGAKTEVSIVNLVDDLKQFDKIILPGQGSFKQCYNSLNSIDGLIEELNNMVLNQKKNILGICVGMQLFADYGDEDGGSKGFGWIKGEVKKIKLDNPSLKLPHMGWNTIAVQKKSKLFEDIQNESHFYFVHSYSFEVADKSDVLAITDYSNSVTAAVEKDNIFGTQFHPEKSQENGIKILENFIKL